MFFRVEIPGKSQARVGRRGHARLGRPPGQSAELRLRRLPDAHARRASPAQRCRGRRHPPGVVAVDITSFGVSS